MIEEFRKPAHIEPEPDDEIVDEKLVGDPDFNFNEGEFDIRERLQVPAEGSVSDMMGKIREQDKSALAAEQWLEENDQNIKKEDNKEGAM